ncbi:DUF4136 domain-containing protein [Echinicola pacifica]|nr:DUF4136 domain-containing protein [Echinicola pacifica]
MLGFLLAGVISCTPGGADYVDDLDLVLTYEDPAVNYTDYDTYHLPDSVVYITNDNSTLDPTMEAFILAKVNSEFQGAGWKATTDPVSNGSDVVLMVTAVDNLNVEYYSWWDYWGWWPGWGYYPSYPTDGFYPYYPGGWGYFGGVYSYRTGTLLVEMVDPASLTVVNDGEPDPLPVIWGGALNGVLDGSDQIVRQRIDRGLDQMMTDSPYLIK